MTRARRAATAQLLCSLVAGAWVAAQTSAAAAPPQRPLQAEVDNLELETSQLGQRFRLSEEDTPAQSPDQRLVAAEVLYQLADYTRAAILFLDYVQRFPNSPGYSEALFHLGDSLSRHRDYLGAKRYLGQLVARGSGPYYQRALTRLIELALRTGELAAAEPFAQALAALPAGDLLPASRYVAGKFHYFARRFDQALALFRSIAPGEPQQRQAAYFIGVCLVAQQDHAQAQAAFAQLLTQLTPTVGPESPAATAPSRGGAAAEALDEGEPGGRKTLDHQLIDLTHLALGRLAYQQGNLSRAADHYAQVSRTAEGFDTALYETAWVYIKQKRLDAALRALDLLVLAQPNSALVPEVTILRGNLLIRLQQWGRASELFTAQRERFDPAQQQVGRLLVDRADLRVFFDALLARDLARDVSALAIVAEVPPLVTDWVKELPTVRRGLGVVADLTELADGLKQVDGIVRRIRSVIDSPQKIRVFPVLAAARAAALELENRLAQARRRLLHRERALVYPMLTPAEQQQLDQLVAERIALDGQISKLPTDQSAFAKRASARGRRVAELEAELSRIGVTVSSVRAQLVAVEKFFADSAAVRDTQLREGFAREAGAIRVGIEALEAEAENLELELANAREGAGLGGPQEVAERGQKERFRALVDREHQLLGVYRGRLPSGAQPELAALDLLLARCGAVDTTLRLFDAELERSVDARLSAVRATLAEERVQLSAHQAGLAAFRSESEQVVGGVAYDGYREIEERFADLVLRSDVGIIDVTWALKEAKTTEVSRLVRQRKLDLQLLDDEFKEVLTER